MAKNYFVMGEVYEIINADSPEEAKKEFINLKGAREESVLVYNEKGEQHA